MTEITHRQVQTNGISMHIAEAGEGPLVVMVHGFPGLWYSWRYQLPALAKAGYHAVAVDQRGYGRTDRPSDPAVYDADYVANDMLGLLDALGEKKAIFIGHDFGAQLVFNTTEGATSLADSKPLRRAALLQKTPYYTTLSGAIAAVEGVKAFATGDLEVRALQDYFA